MGEQARLIIDAAAAAPELSTLKEDVRAGLFAPIKALPPKHLYDARGSELFDAICDTPEYYPTRAEAGLLREHGPEILRGGYSHLVELGSGAARKTRLLFDAMQVAGETLTYVPVDVSDTMLRQSSEALLIDYPWLQIHGVVGAFDEGLSRVPPGPRRLIAFLGGTLGNFSQAQAVAFLSRLATGMRPHDALLLGTDLVKETARLEAAYNDAAGLTAAFNKNLLLVMNRKLGAHFDPERFDHLAFFNQEEAQIEMHLVSCGAQEVPIDALDCVVAFEDGEHLHTEISRKFTRPRVEALLQASGLTLRNFFAPKDKAFGLSIATTTHP